MKVSRSLIITVMVAVVLVTAGGCTTYRMERNLLPASGGKIDREGGFYVAVASDGEYNGKPYPGSGRAVTQAVAAALSKHSLRVKIAGAPASDEATLRAVALDSKLKYVALPTILHWEDRATEWSGIPDKISIRLAFIDADTQQVVDSAVLHGKSKWATFGGDHPQDLLPGALDQYIEQSL